MRDLLQISSQELSTSFEVLNFGNAEIVLSWSWYELDTKTVCGCFYPWNLPTLRKQDNWISWVLNHPIKLFFYLLYTSRVLFMKQICVSEEKRSKTFANVGWGDIILWMDWSKEGVLLNVYVGTYTYKSILIPPQSDSFTVLRKCSESSRWLIVVSVVNQRNPRLIISIASSIKGGGHTDLTLSRKGKRDTERERQLFRFRIVNRTLLYLASYLVRGTSLC